MHEDAAGQYLSYMLIASNQDWKASGSISATTTRAAEAERTTTQACAMVEHGTHHAGRSLATFAAEED
jgi:acetoin utilization deacetylase AcuC-like enzyme